MRVTKLTIEKPASWRDARKSPRLRAYAVDGSPFITWYYKRAWQVVMNGQSHCGPYAYLCKARSRAHALQIAYFIGCTFPDCDWTNESYITYRERVYRLLIFMGAIRNGI